MAESRVLDEEKYVVSKEAPGRKKGAVAVTYSPYMPVTQVDDTADMTEMQGASTSANLAGRSTWLNSPTKSLIVLWVVVLVFYWLVGFFFHGQRS